jgi:rhodanese-related sulfurtransferase
MPATIDVISPAALAELGKKGPVKLIDVRTPAEFESVHASGAINIPLDRLDPAVVLNGCTETVYLICRGGTRGQTACEKLLAANPAVRIVNVDGGTLAWESEGLPVVRGRKHMSIERQVRVAAGALVLLSVLLAFFVHKGLLGIAGLIGAGLVFAGMTDWCGMGMVLGKMPWNRRTGQSCAVKEQSPG